MDNSLTLSRIKFVSSLRQKKFRQETSLFIAEGEKMVEEALHSDFEVEAVYRREEIGEKAMERMSLLSSPSPALAVVKQKELSLSDIQLKSGKLYLAIDSVRDPGNLGTIIRLADWFGVSAVFCSSGTVELYNPKTVQATMGAIFRVRVVYCNLSDLFRKASGNGLDIFGTFLDGAPLKRFGELLNNIGKGSVIVLGNESDGISDDISQLIKNENHILIPAYDSDGNPKDAVKFSGSESLNVATACAAMLSLIRAR